MWSSFLVKRHSSRMFSTFSKIQSNAILLSSMTPTRIKIPVSGTKSLDYPVNVDLTVQEFVDKLKTEPEFTGEVEIGADQTTKMEDLIQKRFEMKVNNRLYTVHPDLSAMVKLNNRDEVQKILGTQEHSVVKRSILSMFLDHLITKLPKDPVSKEQLKKILKNVAATYNPDTQAKMLENIKEEIKNTETELSELYSRRKQLESKAEGYASKMILFGATMAIGQVGAFSYLIYGLYSWDTMEPVTYLVGSFYAWVSMLFYFRFKGDWEWASAYQTFYNRRIKHLCRSHSLDDDRIAFLERYKDLLKLQLAYIEN